MANGNLHNILPDVLVTKQNLIDQNFKINKKFVMVDSRAYTEEAFEYILNLADIAGSIVFVYDVKKIYANGRYFGGDVFQDDLNYFTTLKTFNEIGEQTGETMAVSPQSNLLIQGKSHLKTTAKFFPNQYNKNILELDYDLNAAVDTNYVTIGGTRYNLIVENDKIKLNEYIPFTVTCGTLPPLEYDSVEFGQTAEVSFELKLSGTMPNPEKISIEITNNHDVPISQNGNIITAQIPRNTDVIFTIAYSDGITGGTTSITQKWGYGIWVGTYDEESLGKITYKDIKYLTNNVPEGEEGLTSTKKKIWVPGTFINYSEKINQSGLEYGLFICPEDLDIEFTDVSTNLSGGWTPLFEMSNELYESNIKYVPYRTDHPGLGLVTWKIKG